LSQISTFEYVSILISIILGLGITHLLTALSEILYQPKHLKFYWPHAIWVYFILFLFIQDWIISYQLKDKNIWYFHEVLFVLLYPILLFGAAKMLLPTHAGEEQKDMKAFYFHQYPAIFTIMGISALVSLLFNHFLLRVEPIEQLPIFILLLLLIFMVFIQPKNEVYHKGLALLVLFGSILSLILAREIWVIK